MTGRNVRPPRTSWALNLAYLTMTGFITSEVLTMAKRNKANGGANVGTTEQGAPSDQVTNGADTNRKRTECPVTRARFENEAGPVKVVVSIGDQSSALLVDPKVFSSGSFGWYASDKVTLDVDGVPVKCQAQLQFVIVNSKDAAAE